MCQQQLISDNPAELNVFLTQNLLKSEKNNFHPYLRNFEPSWVGEVDFDLILVWSMRILVPIYCYQFYEFFPKTCLFVWKNWTPQPQTLWLMHNFHLMKTLPDWHCQQKKLEFIVTEEAHILIFNDISNNWFILTFCSFMKFEDFIINKWQVLMKIKTNET